VAYRRKTRIRPLIILKPKPVPAPAPPEEICLCGAPMSEGVCDVPDCVCSCSLPDADLNQPWPWYTKKRVTWPIAGLASLGLWWGIVRAGIWAVERMAGLYSVLQANVVWFWNSGPGDNPWLGPARWGLVTCTVMVVWFLGVGVIEWWRARR
jgi:hypothetical protein